MHSRYVTSLRRGSPVLQHMPTAKCFWSPLTDPVDSVGRAVTSGFMTSRVTPWAFFSISRFRRIVEPWHWAKADAMSIEAVTRGGRERESNPVVPGTSAVERPWVLSSEVSPARVTTAGLYRFGPTRQLLINANPHRLLALTEEQGLLARDAS
jgi:hypothetical protein